MAGSAKKAASKKKAVKAKSPAKRKAPVKKAPAKTKSSAKKVKASASKKSPAKKSSAALARKYPLSKELQAIVGKKESNRSEITKLLWVYIRKHDLQAKEDRREVIPDKKLAKVLGSKKLSMFQFGAKLTPHIITKNAK